MAKGLRLERVGGADEVRGNKQGDIKYFYREHDSVAVAFRSASVSSAPGIPQITTPGVRWDFTEEEAHPKKGVGASYVHLEIG